MVAAKWGPRSPAPSCQNHSRRLRMKWQRLISSSRIRSHLSQASFVRNTGFTWTRWCEPPISLFIDFFFFFAFAAVCFTEQLSVSPPLWGIQRGHGGLLQGWKWKIIMFTVHILQVSLVLPVHSLSSKQILSDGRTNHETPRQNNNLFKLIWEKYIFVLCAVKWKARLMYTLYTHIRTFVLNDHNLPILILVSRPVYLPHTHVGT